MTLDELEQLQCDIIEEEFRIQVAYSELREQMEKLNFRTALLSGKQQKLLREIRCLQEKQQ